MPALSPTQPFAGPSSYTWRCPGSPIQVRIGLSVVDGLQRQMASLEDGVKCGLLLGRAASSTVTEILDFKALSALDPALVEKALMASQGRVVGFYRTSQGGSFCLGPDDLALANASFNHPNSVVLLIDCSAFPPANAAFFVRDRGEMNGDLPLLEFPLDVYRLGLAERRSGPLPVGRALGRRRKSVLWAGVAVVTVVAGAAFHRVIGQAVLSRIFSVSVRHQPAAMSGDSLLGLKAEKVGSDFRLTWNRNSPAISKSGFGMLSIHGDGVTRHVVLDQEQLRSGYVLYAGPLDSSVDITLDVVAADQSVTRESLAMGPRATPSTPRIFPAGQESFPPLADAFPDGRDRASIAETAIPVNIPAPPAAPAEPSTVRSFRPPANSAAQKAAQPALPAPPPLATAAIPRLPLSVPAEQPVLHGPPLPVPAEQPVFHGPRSGRLIWTGSLGRRDVVEIDGPHASVGVLIGALPGLPVNCRVLPAEFGDHGLVVYTSDAARNGREEPASATNGWNFTRYVWGPERVGEIAVLEAPNPSNEFTRLVLRNDSRSRSVILIEWSIR